MTYTLFLMKSLFLIVPMLLSVAFFTLFESKVLAAVQLSIGCSIVGFYGFIQPFADALKLLSKELILPSNSNLKLFLMTPYFSLVLSLIPWLVIPFSWNSIFSDINLTMIFLFSVSSLSVYSMLISGWASNSNYSFFGSLSACGQMMSYEVCVGLILLVIVTSSSSFNFLKMMETQNNIWFLFPLFPSAMLFFICMLAETSSMPFDFPEAESELVSGYNTEFSSVGFVFFFLSEYCRMILMSSVFMMCFCANSNFMFFKNMSCLMGIFFFSMKILFVMFIFILISGTLPSFSYDRLMSLLWKSFLPISLAYFMLVISLQCFFDIFPWVL